MKLFALTLLIPLVSLAQSLPGTYSVPVEEGSALEALATFALEDLKVDLNPEKATLSYTLPRELTGRPIQVQLEGQLDPASGEIHLEGYNGSKATCVMNECRVHYPDIKLNEADVREFLTLKNLDPLEIEQRIELFRRFDSDPFGIVRIQAPTKY